MARKRDPVKEKKMENLDQIRKDNFIDQVALMRDNCYLCYISACRKDECLGVDAKITCGKFSKENLNTHCLASEYLGKHRAFAEIVDILSTPRTC